MLPQFYRFVVVNNSGQTILYNDNARLTLRETAWYINPTTGKIVYVPLADSDMGFQADGSVADGSEIVTEDEIDNTTDLYIGAQVSLEVLHDNGNLADGTFDLYISGGDGEPDMPTSKTGYVSAELNKIQFVGSLTWQNTASDDAIMLSDIFNI